VAEFAPAVAALLELGKIDPRAEWIDYRARGLGREHVPDLTRMLLDVELLETDVEQPASWGPIHAFRALGQLQAVEAMDALIEARQRSHDRGGDWFSEEMHEVMAAMGPAALPALIANMNDPAYGLYPRWNSAECVARIGARYPETRAECVAALVSLLEQLEHAEPSEDLPTLKGGVIGCLVDLKAVEAAPVIERVITAGGVDPFLVRSWEDVRYALGLGPRPARPASPLFGEPPTGGATAHGPKGHDKEKNRRKMAKQSKKKNRKKK
jgi:hypothetical protein